MTPSDGQFDVLIVDDEQALSEGTAEYFNMFGVTTAWVADAPSCYEFLAHNAVSLILLDINLGSQTGFAVCKHLRETTQVPILFISARGSDDDVLLALNVGGDDYIQKPYSLSVLLAKVKTVLRRYASEPAASPSPAQEPAPKSERERDRVAFGDFIVDFDLECVTGPNGDIRLSAMEFRLLAYLVRNQGRIVPKQELLSQVWGTTHAGDGTLNVHIRRLREKLGDEQPGFIRTHWGTGYFFDAGQL
jgi:two-component system response regulator RegX3